MSEANLSASVFHQTLELDLYQRRKEACMNFIKREDFSLPPLSALVPYTPILKRTHGFTCLVEPVCRVLTATGECLFTFFASLAYVPLFLLELQNRLFRILKELHKISFL